MVLNPLEWFLFGTLYGWASMVMVLILVLLHRNNKRLCGKRICKSYVQERLVLTMNSKMQKYMELPYTTVLKRDEDGDVIARIAELKGCVAHGENEARAIENVKYMMALWIESALGAGTEIPLPLSDD